MACMILLSRLPGSTARKACGEVIDSLVAPQQGTP
jgi:hypothetical protein